MKGKRVFLKIFRIGNHKNPALSLQRILRCGKMAEIFLEGGEYMEQVRQGLKGGRQLPLQHSLISEMRAQGAKETRERQTEEQRLQTVGAVKIWSVVE